MAPYCKPFLLSGLELEMEDNDGCESPDIKSCQKCCENGRTIKYDIRRMSYENYSTKCPDYVEPDIVCAFNCGFHEFANEQEAEKETWKPAIPWLTRYVDVPLIFTSYTKTEAMRDYEIILKSSEHDLKTNARQLHNPFRSYRPVRDFEFDNDCDVFYSNQYFSVVRQMP